MKISKENLLRINKGFGGGLRNDASIDFAIQMQENKKLGNYKKLAYLWRAILVDHPFTDGNKRTAIFTAFAFAEEYKKESNRDLLLHHVLSIESKNRKFFHSFNKKSNESKNIVDIRQIEWRLKNAIK